MSRLLLLAGAVWWTGITVAKNLPYAFTPDEARRFVREYCSTNFGPKSVTPKPGHCETVERALSGDFQALQILFTDDSYHTNDTQWNEVPWYILHAVGDHRFADFILRSPSEQRKDLVSSAAPSVGPQEMIKFLAYFRRHFPRTYALSEKYNPPEPEMPGYDYGPRRLGEALAREPRFAEVRLHKSSTNAASTIVVAPKSLSKKDTADLRRLIQKHLADKGVLELR